MEFNKFIYAGFLVAGTILFLAENAFGEHNYKLLIIRMEKPKFDPKWIDVQSIKVKKVNSTCTTINGKLEFMMNLPTDSSFECAMIASNSIGGGKYARSALGFGPSPVCEFIEKDEFAFPSLQGASNLPKKCPLKKGIYEIKEWDVNTAKLIDTLPQPNEWKIEVVLTLNKKEVVKITCYGKIIRTIGI